MSNRKAKQKRRRAEQRQARERRRSDDRAAAARRAQTAPATVASRADSHPTIMAHDAAVLPLIRRRRDEGETWRNIAGWLNERAVSPPGRRAGYRQGGWTAAAVWRIAKRHGLAGRLPEARPAPCAPSA